MTFKLRCPNGHKLRFDAKDAGKKGKCPKCQSRVVLQAPREVSDTSILAVLGVTFNRVNVVLFAMHLKGPMPQVAPASYSPSIFEWGISIGLIAATIFLFGLGARLMPLLPKQEVTQGD